MKKLTLLIVLFLTLGLTATFALDVEPAWAGTGTLTWGVDLNNTATGFRNEATGTVTLTFVDEAVEKGADEAVYGWISLDGDLVIGADATGAFTTTNAVAVTATIKMAPAWIQIYSEPGMEFDLALDAEGDGNVVETLDYSTTKQGATLGLDVAPAAIKVYVVSEGDWTVNTPNAYAFGTDVNLALAPITVDAYAVMGMSYTTGNPTGIGAKAALALPFGGGMSLAANVAADVKMDVATDLEVSFGTVLGLTEDADAAVMTNFAVDVSYSDPVTLGDMDVKVAFTEDEANGFVPNLAASVSALLYDILGTNTMGTELTASGSYAAGVVKPGFSLTYDMGLNSVTDDTTVALNVYVDITAITNVTFKLMYDTPQLLDAQLSAAIPAADKGVVTFATTITY